MPKRDLEFGRVKHYIEALQKCDPEAIVVVPGSDHSYRRPDFRGEQTAELYQGSLFQYWDDGNMFSKSSQKVKVVVIE